MTLAVIIVVVVLAGAALYWAMNRSKTNAPIPMGDRAAAIVVAAPGDLPKPPPTLIDSAAARAIASMARPDFASILGS